LAIAADAVDASSPSKAVAAPGGEAVPPTVPRVEPTNGGLGRNGRRAVASGGGWTGKPAPGRCLAAWGSDDATTVGRSGAPRAAGGSAAAGLLPAGLRAGADSRRSSSGGVLPRFTAYPPTVTPTMFFTRVEWLGIDPYAPLEVHPITTRRTAEFPHIRLSAAVVRGE
jgi:hypothetical protein